MGKTIDFEWYKVFYEVALRGSVSGAAADLAVSQPAVSQSIRNLEQAFGVRLFHRRSRGVELTDTGRKLYSYVRESYRLLKLGERSVRELGGLSAETLLIAAPDDLGTYLLTPLFKAFHTAHPEFLLRTQAMPSGEILSAVEEQRLEAGFVALNVSTGLNDGLEGIEFGGLEEIFVAGGEYNELRGRVLSREELLALPLAVPEPGTAERENLHVYLKPPPGWVPAMESSSVERIRRFAAAGLGIGVLLKQAYTEAGGELFKLETVGGPAPRRGIFVVNRRVRRSPAAEAMRRLVRETYPPRKVQESPL